MLVGQRRGALGHKALVVGGNVIVNPVTLIVDGPITIHGSGYHLGMFGRMSDFPRPLDGHILPVEASPALGEHQQVEGPAMFLVVALEEVFGLGHKALDLRGQQHLGEDGAAVEGVVGMYGIADGKRYRLVGNEVGGGDIEVDGLERLILFTRTRDHQRGLREVGTGDKEKAVGIDMADGVEDGNLMDADRPTSLPLSVMEGSELNLSGRGATCVNLFKEFETALAHNSNAKGLTGGLALGRDVEEPVAGGAVATDLEGYSLGLHGLDVLRHSLRFLGVAGLVVGCEHSFVLLSFLGREDKGATASVLGDGGGEDLLPMQQLKGALAHLAFAGGCFESHTAGDSRHEVSALGEEREAKLGGLRLILEITAKGTECHIAVVVAIDLGFVVNGEDTGVELLVVAEEILGHRLVVEPVFRTPNVVMLGLTPIELPAGVGAQLEVAGVKGVGQGEESVTTPILHLHKLTLDEVAVVVPELAVEHAADAAGAVFVGAAGVGGKPDGVAEEIGGVVHVDEDLLLRYRLSEAGEAVGQTFQGRKGCLCGSDAVEAGLGAFYGSRSDRRFFRRTLHDLVICPESAVVTGLRDAAEHILAGAGDSLLLLVGKVFLPFDIKEKGARLEITELRLGRKVGHFRIFMVVAVVEVDIKGRRNDGSATQLTLAEAQLQVLYLPVEGQDAEREAVDIEYSRHDRQVGNGMFLLAEREAIEVLVVAVHLLHGDIVVMLEIAYACGQGTHLLR